MASRGIRLACAGAAALWAGSQGVTAFLLPSVPATDSVSNHVQVGAQPLPEPQSTSTGTWGSVVGGLIMGAHVGLAVAVRSRTTRCAEEGKTVTKYVETAADKRLFEQVYMDYTREYLKGPMYWHQDKLQGGLPYYPGRPLTKDGKMTSIVVGNLQSFSSNELAFFSILTFAIGLYGWLNFLVYDPQFVKAQAGENLNPYYIVDALCLTISFFMHIACYIQKNNGK